MKPFHYEDETTRINFVDEETGEKHWVEVRKFITHGDDVAIQDAYLKLFSRVEEDEKGKQKASVEAKIDLEYGKTVILTRMITAWSFVDRQGKPASITKEWIDRLDLSVRDLILEEIDRHNPKKDKTRSIASIGIG